MIYNIDSSPEFVRLKKITAAAAIVWLAYAVVFSYACSVRAENRERMEDSQRILKAVTEIKSYPSMREATKAEPIAAVSEILEKTGLQAKVANLSSSSAGLALQINRLHPEEFSMLAEKLRDGGLVVKTAEARLLAANRDGRLLNVTLTIEGE